MVGFWSGFADTFEKIQDRKFKESLFNQEKREKQEQTLLDLMLKRQDDNAEVSKYTNAVSAMRSRLTDSEGNLLPGADAILSDPRAAFSAYEQVMKAEQYAKENLTEAPPLRGQFLLDSITVFSEDGTRVAAPQSFYEDFISGDISFEEAYVGLATPSTPAEPIVELSPEVYYKPDPSRLKLGEEAFKSFALQELNKDLQTVRDDPTKSAELQSLYESYKKDPDGPAASEIFDKYGLKVYERLVQEESPYLAEFEKNPKFMDLREMYEKVKKLRAIIESPTTTQEQKDKAQEFLTRMGM